MANKPTTDGFGGDTPEVPRSDSGTGVALDTHATPTRSSFSSAASAKPRVGENLEGTEVLLVVTKGYESVARNRGIYSSLRYVNLDATPVVRPQGDDPASYVNLTDRSGATMLWADRAALNRIVMEGTAVITATLQNYHREDRPGHTHNFDLASVVVHQAPFTPEIAAKFLTHQTELKSARIGSDGIPGVAFTHN